MPLAIADSSTAAIVFEITEIARADDAALTLPAASVALAVMELMPTASVTSFVKAPEPSAVVVPNEVAPSKSSTCALASAVPVIVRFAVWKVSLSLFVPVSSAAARSRLAGAEGAVTSKTKSLALIMPAELTPVSWKRLSPSPNTPSPL